MLVELFTAQGCSSCPPADRLLTAMGSDPDLGSQVVPLAFNPVRTEPFILYTVMYSRGPKANPEGELATGGSVLVKNRMVFLVTETDRS